MKKKYSLLALSVLFVVTSVFSQDGISVIQSYLEKNLQEFGLQEQDIEGWVVKSETFSEKSSTSHFYAQQTHHGIPIIGAGANGVRKN